MKLISLKIGESFRSLPANFEVRFLEDGQNLDLEEFRPFCMVGLNGCGKSNVLEALAHIFYQLELCVAVHLPQNILSDDEKLRTGGTIQSYHLEYLWHPNSLPTFELSNARKVVIDKEFGKEPQMFVSSVNGSDKIQVSLSSSAINHMEAEGKKYLPKYVVAYSSGENETLSIPFIKSRLLHLDEFKEYTFKGIEGTPTTENGLIYVDANMSQAILLCCLLFEEDKTLSGLRNIDYTGISKITRFRMCLRENYFSVSSFGDKVSYFKVLYETLFRKFKSCSTMSWRDESNGNAVIYYDFYVNDATRDAFKAHFKSGIECFQAFRLLYELNYHKIGEAKEKEIYDSQGIYTEGKFSLPGPEEDTFHFLDFFISKKISKSGTCKEILLKAFSDGEHQFIHTMAICLLLKDSDSLILLDEPETHFNPNWRSRFISMLNETLHNGCLHSSNDIPTCNFLKEVLITSHSPFIISDCLPHHVLLLYKDEDGHTKAETASERSIKTYGTSINVLTAEIFGNSDSIGQRAYQEMQAIKDEAKDKDKAIRKINSRFGESLDKLIAISELKEK